MSRDLKFRAWLKPTHEYKCEFLDRYNKKLPDIDVRYYTDKDFFDDTWINTDDYEEIIVEQYTGLEDKSGKEIYEGDIINVIGIGIAQVIDSPSGEWMFFYRPEPDEINSDFAGVDPKNKPNGLWKTNTTSYIEVIGNIHENPELLGGE